MNWSRLIKFIAQDGSCHYGEPQISSAGDLPSLLATGDLVARKLIGVDPFTARPTDELLKVKRLIGPLSPENVPVIRCVGLNYATHINEMGRPFPPYPSIFIKASPCAAGWDVNIPIPRIAQKDQLDFEGELAIVIGKQGKDISVEDALDYVAGYTVSNDVSARKWQRDPAYAGSAPQWCFGKGFDYWAPMGPMLVSPTVLDNAGSLALQTRLNGEVRQASNTNDLVFGVREIVAFVSQGTTLQKGSVILTGTPGGVILGMKDPDWLKDGDVVEVSIQGIGTIRNRMTFLK